MPCPIVIGTRHTSCGGRSRTTWVRAGCRSISKPAARRCGQTGPRSPANHGRSSCPTPSSTPRSVPPTRMRRARHRPGPARLSRVAGQGWPGQLWRAFGEGRSSLTTCDDAGVVFEHTRVVMGVSRCGEQSVKNEQPARGSRHATIRCQQSRSNCVSFQLHPAA